MLRAMACTSNVMSHGEPKASDRGVSIACCRGQDSHGKLDEKKFSSGDQIQSNGSKVGESHATCSAGAQPGLHRGRRSASVFDLRGRVFDALPLRAGSPKTAAMPADLEPKMVYGGNAILI